MIRESGPPNWASMQWYDAMDAFAAGQAGMTPDALKHASLDVDQVFQEAGVTAQ